MNSLKSNWRGTDPTRALTIGAEQRVRTRPSPWQGADEDMHGDATGVNPLESERLAGPASTAVVQTDAAGINGSTDAGLTPPSGAVPGSVVGAIQDDRLFTISEVSGAAEGPEVRRLLCLRPRRSCGTSRGPRPEGVACVLPSNTIFHAMTENAQDAPKARS